MNDDAIRMIPDSTYHYVLHLLLASVAIRAELYPASRFLLRLASLEGSLHLLYTLYCCTLFSPSVSCHLLDLHLAHYYDTPPLAAIYLLFYLLGATGQNGLGLVGWSGLDPDGRLNRAVFRHHLCNFGLGGTFARKTFCEYFDLIRLYMLRYVCAFGFRRAGSICIHGRDGHCQCLSGLVFVFMVCRSLGTAVGKAGRVSAPRSVEDQSIDGLF